MKEKDWTKVIVVITIVAILFLASIYLAILDKGKYIILDGLLADGYDVVIDRSIQPGEGRYIVRIWRDGGWMAVER